ncbi:MAG: 23S rRNA pseudouridine(1911/1915/1917) synthase RluD [Gammaproteobacteria bacterium]|nr:23S rRNA pseudouridine(1911/1915/1917) synthase RluD [Gammaproteobacteria bacterium]
MNDIFFIDQHTTVPLAFLHHRLDIVLAKLFPEFSRTLLQQWIRDGGVQINGQITREPKTKLHGGEKLQIVAKRSQVENPKPEAIPLDIIYEDEAILVVNKPAGLVTHPGAGQPNGTLQNALLYHVPSLEYLPRAGIVHRLDKHTSGLLVVAKTLQARTSLVRQLQKRTLKRQYEGIVVGKIISGGSIDAPLKRHPKYRTRMAVSESGRPAITHYRVKERFAAHTVLTIMLETGRTHQIRVHLAYIHHPLVGDPVYEGRLRIPPHARGELVSALSHFKRQALHAERLELLHPITKEALAWQVPLPPDMETLKRVFRLE